MQDFSGNGVPSTFQAHVAAPNLLVQWPSGFRTFFANLRDLLLFRGTRQPRLSSPPARFWTDVFVERPVAWRSMATSALYHTFLVVAIYGLSVTWAQRAPVKAHSPFDNSKITYYSVSEYLPEIDTGTAPTPAKQASKGQPKYAKQRIISIPPAPDNFHQTIITPGQIKLPKDVAMPNLVAWTPVPSAVPEAALTQAPSQLKLPAMTPEVIAPAPKTEALRTKSASPMQPQVVAPSPVIDSAKSTARLPNLPEPSVVQPPPSTTGRELGTMNIARLDPTVAAPKLPVSPQRAATAGPSGTGAGAPNAVVAPPANVAGIGNGKKEMGQMIALGLDPASVNGPIIVPNGSRHGRFAATPEGSPNAPGTPDIKGGSTNNTAAGGSGVGIGNGSGSGADSGPPGISVGPAPSQPKSGVVAQGDPARVARQTVMASLERTRARDLSRDSRFSPSRLDSPGRIEDKIFGAKRYYSMTLNMPNLTSAGGSWIIRFAELSDAATAGEVTAPKAMVKVDPAYPSQLMAERVEGTVTLYAVIRKDGTVAEVRVLRGVDERLDENARLALSRWKFHPAMKNGSAVDLEAVVQIPFAAGKMPF